MRKFYLLAMAVAFVIYIVSVVRFPFLGDMLVLFRIDIFSRSLPLSLHSFLNCVVAIVLCWVFLKSWANYLKVVGVRHRTTIEKR